MKEKIKILHIEDNAYDAELIQRELKKSGIRHSTRTVTNRNDMLNELNTFFPDIIISDHHLPEFSSVEAFQLVKETTPELPFIIVSGSISEEFAVERINAGVDDYILKNNLVRLSCAIKSTLCKKEIQKQKNISESLNKNLSEALNSLEEKNKEILDSINYAKRLQLAVMPSPEEINLLVDDHFILNRPKDIVSGDFYFIEPIDARDGRKLTALAVADCTGHGVPGAFMSMLSYGILKNSLTEKSVNSSADVLNFLNTGISKIFRETSTQCKVRDGMDISFCVLDNETKMLYFSGANNPGVIIKKDRSIIELTPDKQPIGYFENSRPFKTYAVQLESGDKLYLFSDGYMDQFGGPLGKKLQYKNMIDKLREVSNKGMTEQKLLLDHFFEMWKGDLKQVDDVLVLGIKI